MLIHPRIVQMGFECPQLPFRNRGGAGAKPHDGGSGVSPNLLLLLSSPSTRGRGQGVGVGIPTSIIPLTRHRLHKHKGHSI